MLDPRQDPGNTPQPPPHPTWSGSWQQTSPLTPTYSWCTGVYAAAPSTPLAGALSHPIDAFRSAMDALSNAMTAAKPDGSDPAWACSEAAAESSLSVTC